MLNITQHLLDIYKPHALISHSKLERGNSMEISDYNIIVVTDYPTLVKPSNYKKCSLDLSGILPEIQVLKLGDTPIWPLSIIYDDKYNWGQKILAETKKAFDEGPRPLSEEEWANRLNYTKCLMNRLVGRGHGPMMRDYYLNDFYESIICYWFEKRGLWTMSIDRSLPVIKVSDPAYYEQLERVWEDDFRNACTALCQIIFGEKNENTG